MGAPIKVEEEREIGNHDLGTWNNLNREINKLIPTSYNTSGNHEIHVILLQSYVTSPHEGLVNPLLPHSHISISLHRHKQATKARVV